MTLHDTVLRIQTYAKRNLPAIIFLEGNLGAGKTHLTNAFAQEIGLTDRLPSPTFTFLQEYKIEWENFKKLVHCDFYRIEPEQAEKTLEQIGFWDYLDANTIIFIEWPERVSSQINELPHATVKITLQEERHYEFIE